MENRHNKLASCQHGHACKSASTVMESKMRGAVGREPGGRVSIATPVNLHASSLLGLQKAGVATQEALSLAARFSISQLHQTVPHVFVCRFRLTGKSKTDCHLSWRVHLQ